MAGMRAHVNHETAIFRRTTNPHFHYYAQMFDTGGNDVLNGVTVQPSPSNVPRRPFRDRGASARRRRSVYRRFGTAIAIAGFAIQTVTLVGAAALPEDTPAGPSSAHTSTSATTSTDSAADPTARAAATPTTTPTPIPKPKPTSPIGRTSAFSFSAPSFSPTNAVRLTGTKAERSSIVVSPAAGGMALCSITASSATDFSCTAAMASGRAIVLSAVETLDDVASAPLSATVDVLGAPTIVGAPDTLTTGLVSGYGYAGSTVSTVLDGGAIGCSAVASDAGFWSCSLTVPSGSYVVRATQSRADLGGGASSSLSGSLSLVVDRDSPGSAAITSPAAGSRVTTAEVTFSGIGEMATLGHHGIADLYVDRMPACQAAIVGGLWSCSVRGMPPGAHSLLVIQRDSAGNYGAPSVPITVFFGAKAGSIPPAPQTAPSSPTSPESPGGPSQPPSAPPQSEAPRTPTPDSSAPTAPPPSGGSDSWGTPTAFGALIPTLASSVSPGSLLVALLLALVFIVLVALPLRLLSGALRGRIQLPSLQFTGRNHSRPRGSSPAVAVGAPINPWLAGAVPLAVAAGLILIAGGVDDQVRDLRLTVAVVLGLAVLNVVGVAISTRVASRGQAVSGRLRFVPLLLLAAVFAALLSRATGIHPPVIAGVLIGVGFTSAVGARARAIVSLVEIGAVTLLATVAWLFHGLFASASGFLAMFVDETLATIALAGFGSVVVLVLPIATLPGHTVFEWSRPAWLATIMVVALFGAVVILGGGEASFPVIGAVLVACAFAALSVAVWGWLRFVDPAPAEARS